jgi:hypothetical protein
MNIKTISFTIGLLVIGITGTIMSQTALAAGSGSGAAGACPDGTKPVRGACTVTTQVPAEERCLVTEVGTGSMNLETCIEAGTCGSTGVCSFTKETCEAIVNPATGQKGIFTLIDATHRTCQVPIEEFCPDGGTPVNHLCTTETSVRPGQGPVRPVE